MSLHGALAGLGLDITRADVMAMQVDVDGRPTETVRGDPAAHITLVRRSALGKAVVGVSDVRLVGFERRGYDGISQAVPRGVDDPIRRSRRESPHDAHWL